MLLYTGKEIEHVVTDLLNNMAATIRSQRTGFEDARDNNDECQQDGIYR